MKWPTIAVLGLLACRLLAPGAAPTNGTAAAVESVDALLRSWGEDVHYSVLYDHEREEFALVRAMGPAVAPDLAAALRRSTGEGNPDAWTRDTAAWLLLELGPDARRVVPELVALLDQTNWNTRRWAAVILGNIGREARPAVPRLLVALRGKSVSERAGAAGALGGIGAEPARVVPALLPLLDDQFEEVRRAAIAALGQFGSQAKAAVPRLFLLLREPAPYIRDAAAASLHKIAPERAPEIQEGLKAAAEADRERFEATFRNDPGLRAEAGPSTNRIEQGLPLVVSFSVFSQPRELPAGVRHLNTFMIHELLTLYLTNTTTGKFLSLDIEPPNGPGPILDQGEKVDPLDGRRLGPWEATFRLVRLRDQLQPAKYACAVGLAVPRTKPRYWWPEPSKDWQKLGLWSGRISSPSFDLEILPETPRKMSLVVPGHPRLEETPEGKLHLVIKKADASTVEVEVRNGCYIGQEIWNPDGTGSLTTGLTDWRARDEILQIPDGARKARFRLTIFETAEPPGHMWHPGPGSAGYRILWKEWFDTNLVSRPR